MSIQNYIFRIQAIFTLFAFISIFLALYMPLCVCVCYSFYNIFASYKMFSNSFWDCLSANYFLGIFMWFQHKYVILSFIYSTRSFYLQNIRVCTAWNYVIIKLSNDLYLSLFTMHIVCKAGKNTRFFFRTIFISENLNNFLRMIFAIIFFFFRCYYTQTPYRN